MADPNTQLSMTERTIIKNISIINEGQITVQDLLIDNGIIQKIGQLDDDNNAKSIDGTGKYLFPGIITDKFISVSPD